MPTASYVLFDTEYATDDGARDSDWGYLGQHREIIRIGAVRVVPDQLWESYETLDLLVRPMYAAHTIYTERLTGITEDMLERDGLSAENAFLQLNTFVDGLPVLSNGNDLNKMAETAGLQGFPLPFDILQFGSLLKPLYRELRNHTDLDRSDTRPWIKHPSGRLHKLFGIEVPEGMGQVHDPLRDVWSIHVTLEALRQRNAHVVAEVINAMNIRRNMHQISAFAS